jgi:hypothetical protein
MRHQWGFNSRSLIGKTDKKERTDHRHHPYYDFPFQSTILYSYNCHQAIF